MPLAELLSLTLNQIRPQPWQQQTPGGTRLRWWAEGVVEVTPAPAANPVGRDLLLSAGIHGNETAPIELLDRLLKAIASDALQPRCRLLLVLGNPAAMRAGERYLDYDLNRLFGGRHQRHPGVAAARAAELESLCQRFFGEAPASSRERLHFDLHTAIRDSAIEKFALFPDSGRPLPRLLAARLVAAAISAVVIQQGPAGTFSAFSANACQADSVTLELGKARPFGANAGVDLSALEAMLATLIGGGDIDPFATDPAALTRYVASREIIKGSEAFRLHLADDVANFTPLPQGMLLAEDGDQQWHVSEANARILFPNPGVKPGLRAGIIVVEG